MTEKISSRTNAMSNGKDTVNLRKLLDAAQDDLTLARAQINALVTDVTNLIASHNTLIAKLNLDGGVTDTDYAAATAQTSAALSALTFTK